LNSFLCWAAKQVDKTSQDIAIKPSIQNISHLYASNLAQAFYFVTDEFSFFGIEL